MATQGPTPVDTGTLTSAVVRPLDRSPAAVPPGPGTTGQIASARTPVGPPELAPPAVPPGPGAGQSANAGTAPVVPVLPPSNTAASAIQSVTANTSEVGPNITPGNIPNYIEVLANGVIVVQNSTAINFTGTGVTVTANGAVATINVTGGTSYGDSNVVTLLSNFGSNTVSTTGNVTGGYILGNGSQLTGIIAASSYGNANVVANLAAMGSNPVSTTGNVTAGYIFGNGSQLTGLPANYGNANVGAFLPTYTGNLTANTISTTGNITTAGYFVGTFAGNISGNLTVPGSNTQVLYNANGNAGASTNFIFDYGTNAMVVTGTISSTGNITGANIIGNGAALTSITGANVTGTVANATFATSAGTATSATTAGTVTSNAQANITSVGILTSLSASGNITGNYILGNGSQLTGIAATYGNANVVANLAALDTNPVSTTGNVTAGYFVGNGSALGSLTFGNITTFNTAGLTTDELYLQGITRLNVTASGSSGYIFDQYGTSTLNPVLYISSGQTLAFNLNVSGHPFLIRDSAGANYSTGLSHVATTGTVLADSAAQGQVAGTLYWKVPYGITGNYKYQCSIHGGMVANIVVSDANVSNIAVGSAVTATTAGTVTTAAQANITSVGTLTSLNVTGNTATGNLTTAGQVSAVGNVTGNYFVGNGSQLTGLAATYGNANVVANLAALGSNPVSTTGNITGGNILGGANVNATTHTGTTVSVSANVTGGNVLTGGLISATSTITSAANVNGGNLNATGLSLSGNVVSALVSAANITTTANVSGNFFIGNGSQLTGIAATYGNADVVANLAALGSNPVSTTGNVTSGNVLTGGLISATGNVTGGNLSAVNLVINNITSDDSTLVSVHDGLQVFGNIIADNLGNVAAINLDGNVSNVLSGTGTWIAAGGGGGNTGNVTFDDQAVVGTGDQVGGSGLYLAPGTESVGNLQYIRVRGGDVATHIHLDTGNNAYFDQYFGDDGKYVKLANTGNVVIGSDNANGNSAQWTFGTDGSLTLPIGVSIDYNGNVQYPKIIADSGKLFSVQGQGNSGSAALAWTVDPNAASQYAAVAVNRAGDNLAKVILQAQSDSGNVATVKLWKFDETGNLSAPGNVSAVGNVTAGGLTINGTGVVTGNLQVQGNLTYNNLTNITTTNLVFGLANATTGISANGAGFVVGNTNEATFLYNYSAQAWNSNIGISAVGNVTGGNVVTAGQVSATGNVTGNYILGNGALLTGVITSVANINSGTSNVTVVSSGGNITVGVGGTANVVQFATTGAFVTGVVSATGNITGGNVRTGGVVSATGNITGGNILGGANVNATTHTGTTVSVTANVTGGNILTAGQVSATGNITTANSFVGNLTGTTVSVTGNVTAGNVVATSVIVNGQPTTYGYVNGAYLLAQNTTDQSVGLNGVVNFQTTNASNGSIITKTSNSQVTLAAGNTYKLEAIVRRLTSSSTWGAFRWYDVTNAAYVGIEGFSEVVTGSAAIGSTNVATVYVTPSVNTTYELRQTTVNTISVSANYATIEITQVNPAIAVQATATGTVATNYIATTRTGTNQTFTSAGDVILNTTDQSVGSSVTYNTSTGVYTLVAGTTYELSFTPSWTFSGSSNDAYVQYDWVDASTNTALDGNSGSFATAYSYNYNYAQHNFNIISKLVYTPSTNQTVKVRVTGTQAGGITTTLGVNSSAYVKAMNAIFALNTLETMTITGNVSVGGSLSAAQFVGNYSNGTSNVNIPAANGNVNISSGGTANVVVVTPNAVVVTGNVTAGNILTGGLISATGNVTGGNILGGANVNATTHTGTTVSVSANVTGGNILTGGLISATSTITSAANITGGNVLTSGLVSATGNVTGGNLNAAGLSLSSNVVSNLNVTSNIAGGNITTPGLINGTGNVTGGNLLTAGIVSATGTITSAGNLSLTGNIVDIGELWINTSSNGNINLNPNGTGNVNIPVGVLSVTGNVQSGNLRTGGLISATGNVTGGNLIGIYANGTSNISIPTISANILFSTAGNANVLVIANTGIVANVLAPTTATPANGVGYIGLPVSSVTGTGTLTIVDAGKLVYITGASQTVTIPANSSVAYPIGTAITFIAGPASSATSIAITSDTLYLAGTGSTGTRTLSANAMATAVKVTSTVWYINGTGLT